MLPCTRGESSPFALLHRTRVWVLAGRVLASGAAHQMEVSPVKSLSPGHNAVLCTTKPLQLLQAEQMLMSSLRVTATPREAHSSLRAGGMH